MGNKNFLLNKEVILIDWDWPNDKGPKCIEALITNEYSNDKYEISLSKPLTILDGSSHQKLIIEGRHKNYPIVKIIPSFIMKIFIFNIPLLFRIGIPLVAVNVSTEEGVFFSIAFIYLKSVYLKINKLNTKNS